MAKYDDERPSIDGFKLLGGLVSMGLSLPVTGISSGEIKSTYTDDFGNKGTGYGSNLSEARANAKSDCEVRREGITKTKSY